MQSEVFVLNQERNVSLTAYIQGVGGEFRYVAKRPAVLILPGGAYMNCSDREADPVAFAYLTAGYHAFILRYSVAENKEWPNPLSDYEQAMEFIRKYAKQWGIYENAIAVIGFSAGGNLAAAAATISVNRPNAAVLGYAATLREDTMTINKKVPDFAEAVNGDTCPCFLFATQTDELVPVMNTVKFAEALTRYDVSYECHIYPYGPHGVVTCDSSVFSKDIPIPARMRQWVRNSIDFLRDIFGEFGPEGLETPICRPSVTDDYKSLLSLECTTARIRQFPEANRLVQELMEQLRKRAEERIQAAAESGAQQSVMDRIIADSPDYLEKKMTLRYALSFAKATAEELEELNEKLGRIPLEKKE